MSTRFFVILFICSLFPFGSSSQPLFVAVKSTPANVRVGPGIEYPIAWVYVVKYLPLKVVEKFESWTKVEDIYGEAGWINNILLCRSRYLMAIDLSYGYRLPSSESAISAVIEKSAMLRLVKCKQELCKVEIDDVRFWVNRQNLWGLQQ